MKQDGAYQLLQGEDLESISSGYNLEQLNESIDHGVDILDSRFSTIHSDSASYNGALIARSEEKLSRREIESIEEQIAELGSGIDSGGVSLMYEAHGEDGCFYTVADTGIGFDL